PAPKPWSEARPRRGWAPDPARSNRPAPVRLPRPPPCYSPRPLSSGGVSGPPPLSQRRLDVTQPLLRIGTRRSRLALAQSGMMQRAIGRALGVPEAEIETLVPLVEIVTTGDRIQDRRLLEVGGKALFTKEIEEALRDGRVDVAVHSMKDVPAEQPPGLAIAAVPEREDPRDAFISERYATFADLPQGARFGTASLRRQAQA